MRWIALLTTISALAVPVWAQEGTITIKKASADKEHVVVTFEHKPVASSDQIHVFVDDVFVKVVHGRNTISVDLEPGNHTIDLRDATRDHEVRGGCKRVQVTISKSHTETSRSLSPEGGEVCKP